MSSGELFVVFVQSVCLSFSGWGSVAVVRESIVKEHALITDSQLSSFLALSQITPGPLGFYLLFVGYTVNGIVGLTLAWLALALPALLVVPIHHLLSVNTGRWLKGAATGVIVASAALMLSSAWSIAPSVLTSTASWTIAALSLLVLFTGRVPSFVVVILAAITGTVFL